MHVGPKKDIVGTWAKIARKRGLRFGVTNHSAHAWHWFQTAYGYDPEGAMAGVRYDGFTTKEQRQGQMVGRARPAGTVHRRHHGDARRPHHHQSRAATGTNSTTASGPKQPPPNNPEFVEPLVPALPGTGGQVRARPALFRQYRAAAGPGRPGYRRALLQRQHQKTRRETGGRAQLQGTGAGSQRRHGAGHRTRTRRQDSARGVADRYLHRRLALPPLYLREPYATRRPRP